MSEYGQALSMSHIPKSFIKVSSETDLVSKDRKMGSEGSTAVSAVILRR